MPWVRNHLFASCGVQRYCPPLAQQNMLLTRLLPLFKSKARFFRDHSIKHLRGCAVFSFRLIFVGEESKKFDLTTAVTAHVQTSAWPGELTVSLLPLYVQCAICSCLIFNSLRHYSRSTDTHCLFRASFTRSAVVLVFVEQPAKSCFSIARYVICSLLQRAGLRLFAKHYHSQSCAFQIFLLHPSARRPLHACRWEFASVAFQKFCCSRDIARLAQSRWSDYLFVR